MHHVNFVCTEDMNIRRLIIERGDLDS